MRTSKIKIEKDCEDSNNLVEIDTIYFTDCENEKYYKKTEVHDYLVKHRFYLSKSVFLSKFDSSN